jgi:NAD(P)H-dependent FMN reductase
MRIVAIDASRGHRALNRTLQTVAKAASDCGAELSYIRLCDFQIRDCLDCKLCVMGDGCQMQDDLPYVQDAIIQANAIIVGTTEKDIRHHRHSRGGHRALDALLKRISSHFGVAHDQPTLPGINTDHYLSKVAHDTKRAIIISSAASEGGIAAFFSRGISRGAKARQIRSALAACNINSVGSLSVERGHLINEDLTSEQHNKAYSLGRILAGRV